MADREITAAKDRNRNEVGTSSSGQAGPQVTRASPRKSERNGGKRGLAQLDVESGNAPAEPRAATTTKETAQNEDCRNDPQGNQTMSALEGRYRNEVGTSSSGQAGSPMTRASLGKSERNEGKRGRAQIEDCRNDPQGDRAGTVYIVDETTHGDRETEHDGQSHKSEHHELVSLPGSASSRTAKQQEQRGYAANISSYFGSPMSREIRSDLTSMNCEEGKHYRLATHVVTFFMEVKHQSIESIPINIFLTGKESPNSVEKFLQLSDSDYKDSFIHAVCPGSNIRGGWFKTTLGDNTWGSGNLKRCWGWLKQYFPAHVEDLVRALDEAIEQAPLSREEIRPSFACGTDAKYITSCEAGDVIMRYQQGEPSPSWFIIALEKNDWWGKTVRVGRVENLSLLRWISSLWRDNSSMIIKNTATITLPHPIIIPA